MAKNKKIEIERKQVICNDEQVTAAVALVGIVDILLGRLLG